MMLLSDQTSYRIPACLRDLVMVDLLELTGSTTAAAQLLQMSQPNVSRRYRMLAQDVGLERQNHRPIGRRYGDTDWMALLRRGANHHRLAHGTLRIGARSGLEPAFMDVPWAQWIRLRPSIEQHWCELLSLELLDAVAMRSCPDLTDTEAARLTVFEVAAGGSGQLLLICRADPLVLDLCSSIGGRDLSSSGGH